MNNIEEAIVVRLEQSNTVNPPNVQSLAKPKSGYATPLDLTEDENNHVRSRGYVDALGAHLAGMHILQANDFYYRCYLIDGFSVKLTYLAHDATALAVLDYQKASQPLKPTDMDFSLYTDDISVDNIINDVRRGDTAVFLGNSLPCFGTRNRYNDTWGRNLMLAIVYRDEVDSLAA